MAKINTIFGFVDNVTNPLRRMNNALRNTENSFSAVQRAIITANSAMAIFSTVKGVFDKITASISATTQAYQYQAEQELKLETIMKQRMNATQADIKYIKELANAEQQLGIYGDEMILQGAQELASFTSTKEAIAELVPAMNNLIAQQYGYSASGRDFQSVADMMGKVLSGQTGALSRMGYIFSEEEKQLLKTGTEMQRASTLAKIITDNVGEMNHALAGTDAGQIKNVTNKLADLKESIGKTLLPIRSAISRLKNSFSGDFLTIMNSVLTKIVPIFVKILDGVNSVYNVIKNVVLKIKSGIDKFVQGMVKNLNSIVVSLTFVASVFVSVGAVWIATHAKMLAVTIATNIKILASWIATHAKMVAVHAVAMAKIAFQFIIAHAWIIAIIGLIALLIVVWVKVGMTFERVGSAIGKVFGAIYASGYNAIIGLINLFIKLQNVIADSFIGKNLGMQKWELKEYKNIKETMEAGAEKGGAIGKGMDDWVKGLQNKLSNKNNIADGIQDAFNFSGSGAIEVTDKNLVKIADDYKELLSKRATERFNLQYKNVTPSINIDHMDIHEEADADKVIGMFSNALNEFSSSDLRGYA